ncbi:hypothetical protein EVAR_18160_1 [Eumeta japonica]|uniref:Uncharacterized protein n=1 Tax=Eumeta variegata TaxID=151549 RepID=A0A4C1UV48_EUMVA|nr:hypothetical protein EVAR_18160_1 [Eumeta japonica]
MNKYRTLFPLFASSIAQENRVDRGSDRRPARLAAVAVSRLVVFPTPNLSKAFVKKKSGADRDRHFLGIIQSSRSIFFSGHSPAALSYCHPVVSPGYFPYPIHHLVHKASHIENSTMFADHKTVCPSPRVNINTDWPHARVMVYPEPSKDWLQAIKNLLRLK